MTQKPTISQAPKMKYTGRSSKWIFAGTIKLTDVFELSQGWRETESVDEGAQTRNPSLK